MSNFKVGQKVICVDNTGVELVTEKSDVKIKEKV